MKLVQINNTKIESLIHKHYPEIGQATKTYKIVRSTWNNKNFVVTTNTGDYLVKELHWARKRGSTLKEQKDKQTQITTFTEYLRNKGLTIPQMFINKDGEQVSVHNSQAYTVEEYIGELTNTLAHKFTGTDNQIEEAAHLLAKYHNIEKTIPKSLREKVNNSISPRLDLTAVINTYKDRIRQRVLNEPIPEKLDENKKYALIWCKDNIEKLDMLANMYQKAITSNQKNVLIHRDMHPGNVLWVQPAHLIDFDSVQPMNDEYWDFAFSAAYFGLYAKQYGRDSNQVSRQFTDALEHHLKNPLDRTRMTTAISEIEASKAFRILEYAYEKNSWNFFNQVPKRVKNALEPQQF